MDASEMTEVSVEVELLGDDGVSSRLLKIESGRRDEVSGREEVRHLLSDVEVDLLHRLVDVSVWKRSEFESASRFGIPGKEGRKKEEELTVEEINSSDIPSHVLSNLSSNGSDGLVELLLDDHVVEESGEENFLVLRRIGVVGAGFGGDERVELSKHEPGERDETRRDEEERTKNASMSARARVKDEEEKRSSKNSQQHPELIPRIRQMNQHHPFQQPSSDDLVRPILRHSQHDLELGPEVLQTLLPRPQPVVLEPSQQQLDSIRQERILGISLNQPFEDLEITRARQRLEDEHERDHELVLPPREPEGSSTGREVVKGVGDGGLILSNATDLGTEGGVTWTSFGEGGTKKGDDVVTTRENEVSDDLFVSVDDEVASEGSRLFVSGDESGGGGTFEVAARGLEE